MKTTKRKRPSATLQIGPAQGWGPQARHLVVECPNAITSMVWSPAALGVDLDDDILVLVAGWKHEEECSECDVEPVLKQGNPQMRQRVDRMWAQHELAERRN